MIGIVGFIQVLAVSTSWRLLVDFFTHRKAEKKLIAEKMDAELRFLRSQINPHFLFNTLNNIISLIRKRPDEAEKSVVRLSVLMRYMLNTGQKEKVQLAEELEYIRNFIDLQKLSLPPGFPLRFQLSGNFSQGEIEPLLLIGFIENAFKHGMSGSEFDFIEIDILLEGNQLTLKTRNAIPEIKAHEKLMSGVGLKNTMNRLEICYCGNYKLDVNGENGIYSCHLEINL